ncbi:MAG: hypothetical protein H8D42_00530, partial [Candidatus Marinimicrobia bacterium]|nr:hypothetical protein [Candidatus Neomarinimicrobiota bacterium]
MSKTGFAPQDITDGRELLDWESKYPKDAKKDIMFEARYIVILLIASVILIFLFLLDYPRNWISLCNPQYVIFKKYMIAWLGGIFGHKRLNKDYV